MDNRCENILNWANEMKAYEPVSWEKMPEIYLYMDQVITYMDKQLHLFEKNEATNLLTSSMINNYVKDGVLPRPEKKKYAKEHLAMLSMICALKQVLPIGDISDLLKAELSNTPSTALYDEFRSIQSKAFEDICQTVIHTTEDGESALAHLAFQLSIEANARRTVSERILSELTKAKSGELKNGKERK